jgi:hypothetical protein
LPTTTPKLTDRLALTAKILKKYLHYDRKTGLLTWLVTTGSARAGDVAGCLSSKGYVKVGLLGHCYFAHRLAWLHSTGAWPADQLDHRNCQRADNRRRNLREATRSQNGANSGSLSPRNTSGFRGAVWHDGRWEAVVKSQGRIRYFGRYDTAAAAGQAAATARAEIFGAFAPTTINRKAA